MTPTKEDERRERYISFPCPNPTCKELIVKMGEELIIDRNTLQFVVSTSNKYRRYVCKCGTELRIPNMEILLR